jgi:phosphoglycolate phosphatase-like HAD superfamily hydrolase
LAFLQLKPNFIAIINDSRASVSPSSFPTGSVVMKIRGVLFDVDGTLADSFLVAFTSSNTVLTKYGYSAITEEEYHEGSKFSTPRRLAWHALRDPEHPIGEQLGKDFDDLYIQFVSKETTPLFPGIKGFLSSFVQNHSSLKFGCLSNACTEYVVRATEANEVSSHFSVLLGCNSVPEPKPSALGLLKCCELLNLEVGECIFIGDSPTDGMAAQNAKMISIGVTWGSYPIERIEPCFTYIVKTVTELSYLVEQLVENSL